MPHEQRQSEESRVIGMIDRLRSGDLQARDELIAHSCGQLQRLVSRMLSSYPRLRRWEQTDDVLQNALLRLHRSLAHSPPESANHFFRLAALQIRRELIDLCRHHFGPQGHGAAHESHCDEALANDPARDHTASEPVTLAQWSEFHERVQDLPDDERETFELLWYQGLTQAEAAQVLGVSLRTASRRWQGARIHLSRLLRGQPPQ